MKASTSQKGHLFEREPYLKEYTTNVAAISEAEPDSPGKFEVILQETIFFPGGGGQPGDEGFLGGAPIKGYRLEEDVVVNFVDAEFEKGDTVVLRLDWDRRFDHMQQHTGQHILSQAIQKTLGYETYSFHMGADDCTIDILARDMSDEDAAIAEEEANRVVMSTFPIENFIVSPKEARNIDLRKLPETNQPIRVVRIGDFDSAACCGTHLSSSGEVGLIKITKLERVKGYIRVYFLCGHRALRNYRETYRICREISYTLGKPFEDLTTSVDELEDMRRALAVKARKESREKAQNEASRLVRQTMEKHSDSVVEFLECDPGDLAEVISVLRKDFQGSVMVAAQSEDENSGRVMIEIPEPDQKLFDSLMDMAKKYKGNGGGKGKRLNLGGFDEKGINDFMEEAVKLFR